MVQPVTGPYVEESWNDSTQVGSFWKYKARWKQKPPFLQPLPYTAWERTTDKIEKLAPIGPGQNANQHNGYSPRWMRADVHCGKYPFSETVQIALTKAKERFLEKVRSGDGASLGVSFAERRQSFSMIAGRARQLRQAVSSLKQGNLKKFAETLAMGDPEMAKRLLNQKHRVKRTAANQFLEYHFGWSPLIGDIFNACQTLSAPLPFGRVRASSIQKISDLKSATSPGQWSMSGKLSGQVRALVGAEVRVSNPDLYLLESMGLANPASVAWELVPWSFVVDWFVDVGGFLSQLTDTVGLDLQNSYHSASSKEECFFTYSNGGDSIYTMTTSAYGFERKLGFPVNYSPKVVPLKAPSPTRAVTAISLLIQKLPKR